MFHVHTPQPSTGTTTFLDVEFHDGVAHLDELHPIREQALIQHGYTVVQEIVGTALEDMTVPELRQLAKDEGLDMPAKAKKTDLIAALDALPVRVLTAADAEAGVEPVSGGDSIGDGPRDDSGATIAAAHAIETEQALDVEE